jgi:tetratricopeptide (TPR) repeat protein
MRFLCGQGSQMICLAACMGSVVAVHADCTGPQAMTTQLHRSPTTENSVRLGSWFAENKQFQCAVEIFRNALQKDPKSAQLDYLEGLALMGWGHPSEGIPALLSAIRLQPGNIKPRLALAELYEQSGQHVQADGQWRQSLAINPRSEPALDAWSSALLARKDYVGVVALLRPAPRTETLAIRLSATYETLGLLHAANGVLGEAMRLSPRSVPLAIARAKILVKQRRSDEAAALLSVAVQRDPTNLETQQMLFRILVLTGHGNRARALGQRLLAELPHNAEIFYLNGIIERAAGDDGHAKAHLEEAVALDPGFVSYQHDLGTLLVVLHEWSEAKIHLEKAISLGDTVPEVHYELGLALRGLGENELAAQQIKEFQQIDIERKDAREAVSQSFQADAYLAAGKVQQAIALYRQACARLPGDAVCRFRLSFALRKAGDIEGQRTMLEEVVRLNPKLAAAQSQLGYIFFNTGEIAAAVEHFQMAVSAAPASVEAWIDLACGMGAESHFREARQAVATALRLDPNNSEARELKMRLARGSGNP